MENDPKAIQFVNFVYCDINCKVKVFTKSEKHLAFNSEHELMRIIYKLDIEATASKEFLNRLSDYLFVVARSCARITGIDEVLWQKG